MAGNEPDTPEQPDAHKPEPTESGGGRRFALILIPVLLIMTATGGWLAYSQYQQVDQTARNLMAYFVDPDTAESNPREYGSFYEIKGLIINPASSDGARYLRIDVGLESDEEKVISALESKEVVVRDRIIRLLGERPASELGDITLRDTLKTELRRSINDVLSDGSIDRIYFTQYVLQ